MVDVCQLNCDAMYSGPRGRDEAAHSSLESGDSLWPYVPSSSEGIMLRTSVATVSASILRLLSVGGPAAGDS